MVHSAALPFVLHREHDVINWHEVTSTREQLHGLLRVDGEHLHIQWRATRKISRVGREIRTDLELAPIREVTIPLSGVAGARIRWTWRRWPPHEVLVLTATDLRAFDALTGEGDVPGLVLEHPAEIVLDLRWSDRKLAREFVSELRLAISEHLLASLEKDSEEDWQAPQLEDTQLDQIETEKPAEVRQAIRQKS